MKHDEQDLGRRGFLSGVGAAAGVVAVGGASRALADARRGDVEPSDGSALGAAGEPVTGPTRAQGSPLGRERFATLQVGDRVGRWTIVAIYPQLMGAVPFVLETGDGVRFQIDVLRRDDRATAPRGVCNTETLSLFLANRGNGSTATDEEQGLGAMALGDRLHDLDTGVAGAPGLLTYEERRERHPVGAFSVPLR